MSLLELDAVRLGYGRRSVLDGVSLVVDRGERVAIEGPSGCGKTTVLRLLAGLALPDSGRVLIDGVVAAENGRLLIEPERRAVGLVFQDLALWPHLSVEGNVALGLKARRVPKPERTQRVHAILERVGLEDLGSRKPAELSGGQQQRVALARALVLEPRALLLDEPLASLDRELSLRLRQEILALHRELGFTLLHVTHDREEAKEIATRVVYMERGKIRDATSR
ncbi:MAG TPA: ABC transporter ATP-binding protein [Acidobacteria bacterium]|nr:ABC transporter ATP-binding protein [Acidobacteriota bacterium]